MSTGRPFDALARLADFGTATVAEVTPQAQIWDAGLRPLARGMRAAGLAYTGWEKEEVVMRRIRAGETTVEIFDLNA